MKALTSTRVMFQISTYNEGTYIDESHVSNFNETNNSLKFYVNEGTYLLTHYKRPLKSTMFQESN